MDKYSEGKLYKLINDNTGLCYVGSTIEKYLSRRLAKHKGQYKRYLQGCGHYYTSFKVIQNDGYRIELIEHYPCQSKYELEKRERFWIENTDCVNKIIPTRTDKEWREQNKEHIQKYLEQNKEYIKQRSKDYRARNKEHIKQVRKKYRELNQVKIKEYYEKTKARQHEKYTCECGGRYTHQHKSTHLKSKKHKLYIEKQK